MFFFVFSVLCYQDICRCDVLLAAESLWFCKRLMYPGFKQLGCGFLLSPRDAQGVTPRTGRIGNKGRATSFVGRSHWALRNSAFRWTSRSGKPCGYIRYHKMIYLQYWRMVYGFVIFGWLKFAAVLPDMQKNPESHLSAACLGTWTRKKDAITGVLLCSQWSLFQQWFLFVFMLGRSIIS